LPELQRLDAGLDDLGPELVDQLRQRGDVVAAGDGAQHRALVLVDLHGVRVVCGCLDRHDDK
jgi:hypothetical protein